MAVVSGTILALTGVASLGVGAFGGSALTKGDTINKDYKKSITNQNSYTTNTFNLKGKGSSVDFEQSSLITAETTQEGQKNKQNNGLDFTNPLLIGGLGVGAYLLYRGFK